MTSFHYAMTTTPFLEIYPILPSVSPGLLQLVLLLPPVYFFRHTSLDAICLFNPKILFSLHHMGDIFEGQQACSQ